MMHKTALICATTLALLLFGCSRSSNKYLEKEAIDALDKTTETIGNLTSVSLRMVNESTENVDGGTIDHLRQSDVYLRGNNNLYIYTTYDDVRRGYWFDGDTLSVFRFDENMYDATPAPSTTLTMIDSLHKRFKIDFAAADVFYPTLTDDMIAHFDSIFYLGAIDVNGISCIGVNAVNPNLSATIFVDESTNLPVQLELYYRGTRMGEKYISFYQDWQLNPKLAEEMFKFSPPVGAKKGVIFKRD